jgi:tripartite-type tricarboxylate transporter receptor subunit TctC
MEMLMKKIGLMGAVVALCTVANAQTAPDAYPSKPITLVVPYSAGGSTDLTARQFGLQLSKILKQPVVVENRPGGSTTIAAAHVARAPADGYTLLYGDSATFVYNKFLFKNLRYDALTSFDPISLVANGSMVLAAGPAMKVDNLAGLVAKIKQNPSAYSYGSAGAGSPPHILMEGFLQAVGVKGVTHVPYRGEQPGLTDMMAGTIGFMFLGPRSAKVQSDAGTVNALGWGGPNRIREFANLPTISEVVPGFQQQVWQAMVVPKGTPKAVIDKLNQALRQATQSEDFKRWVKDQVVSNDYTPSTPQEVTRLIESDQARVGRIITEANISME